MVAANNATRHTLIDVAKRLDPDGSRARIAEVLAAASPAFQDAPFLPSNSQMGNRVTIRSSVPTPTWTKINEGVAATKSTTRQLVDSMGILTARSEVDVKMKFAVGDFAGYRFDEDRAFLEGIAQTAETTIFTGNEASNEASFTGFAPRFATLSSTLGAFGYQIVDGAGTGTDNESIWLVDWGMDACHLIYPKNTPAGLDQKDLGEDVMVLDASSNQFRAAVTEFTLAFGLTVKNPRHVCRIANLDKSDLAGATPPNLVNAVIAALHKMAPQAGASRVLYCSRNVALRFEQQAIAKSNLALPMMDWAGQPTPTFRGIPIRETDALGADEARIT